MSGDRARCPVPGCTNTHGLHLLMCFKHWKKVPRLLQQAVYRSHEAMAEALASAPDSTARIGRLTARYREARDLAIAAAAGAKPPQPELSIDG